MNSKIKEGNARVVAAMRQALKENRPLRCDWKAAVGDAITELEIAQERVANPDARGRIVSAFGCLTGMWFDEDEVDDIYEGDGAEVEPEKLDRAGRTAAQIEHLKEHQALFENDKGPDVAEYMYTYGSLEQWDLYQRVCEDLGIAHKPEICHPNPED